MVEALRGDEHLRGKRDRQHERDRRGRRGELCSDSSGDPDQRNAREKKAAQPDFHTVRMKERD